MMVTVKKRVLLIYTGGTIGMLPKDESDPFSPLIPASWEKIKVNFGSMNTLPIDVVSFEMKSIDSSDMNPDYWIEIAKTVRDNYTGYDGFVILHGTDTMTYTATALSFLFENLGKPVIITGSQLPLAQARNDAEQNLVTALIIAASLNGSPIIPEVCIFFNNLLLRGNRSRKVSSSGFAGFSSPNYRPLAEIGEHIKIDTKLIRKTKTDMFFINEVLNPNVMVLDIFPGINTNILKGVFNIGGLRGVILRTYGTGNAPTNEDFLNEIERAITEKKLAIVNISQCAQGMVEMGLYDASVRLSRIGVISGADMTPEAAIVKMMFLLAQGYDIETVKEQMQKDLRGEQSVNVFNFVFNQGETGEKIYHFKSQKIPAGLVKEKIVKANIRFDDINSINFRNSATPLKLAVFMNYQTADAKTTEDIPQCLGVIEMNTEQNKADGFIECTHKINQLIDSNRPLQLTAVAQAGNISWNSMVLSIYTDVVN